MPHLSPKLLLLALIVVVVAVGAGCSKSGRSDETDGAPDADTDTDTDVDTDADTDSDSDTDSDTDSESDTSPGDELIPLWSIQHGDWGGDRGTSLAIHADGSITATGYFQGAINFGGGLLSSDDGSMDVYLLHLLPGSNHEWSAIFGDYSSDSANGVALDSSENVLLAGEFGGTVDFGGDPIAASGIGDDVFVGKYDNTGAHIWSNGYGGSGSDSARAVAVDGADNVALTGSFYDTVDFGGDSFATQGAFDIFVTKLDQDGNHVWSESYGDIGDDEGRAIDATAGGDLLVTGCFEGSIDLGGDVLSSAGGKDIFVVKLDATGSHLWSNRFGASGDDCGEAVVVDSIQDVIIAGYFETEVDFGDGPMSSAGGKDGFIAKLDSAGNHLWSTRFGDIEDDEGLALAVDALDNVYSTGYFEVSADFGGELLESDGGFDVFLARHDSDGVHAWSYGWGDEQWQVGHAVEVDSAFNVVLTGRFSGTIDFGSGELDFDDATDIFITKFGQ